MKPCVILETLHGLELLRLKNPKIEVQLLPEKGCNILQIQDEEGRKILAQATDLQQQFFRYQKVGKRSLHYAEHYEGGWQDVFPSRYGDSQDEYLVGLSGEGCTLPWKWKILNDVSEHPSFQSLVEAEVELPVSHFRLKKKFLLGKTSPCLRIETEVTNLGSDDLLLNWNQHPAFGEDLLHGEWTVQIPEGVVVPVPFLNQNQSADFLEQIPLDQFKVPETECLLQDHRHQNPEKDLFLCIRDLKDNTIQIQNKTTNFGVELKWDLKTYPHLWYWAANRKEIQTTAFEPSSTWLPNYRDSDSQGLLQKIHSHEKISTWVELHIKECSK